MATPSEDFKRPDNLEDYRPGRSVSKEEIQKVLADEGYSTSERETWLKSLLTDISQDQGETGGGDDEELVRQIEAGIDRLQPRQSQAESD